MMILSMLLLLLLLLLLLFQTLGHALIAALLINVYIVGLNQITDVHIDRVKTHTCTSIRSRVTGHVSRVT